MIPNGDGKKLPLLRHVVWDIYPLVEEAYSIIRQRWRLYATGPDCAFSDKSMLSHRDHISRTPGYSQFTRMHLRPMDMLVDLSSSRTTSSNPSIYFSL